MEYEIGDRVQLTIQRATDLGYVVLIDDEFEGLLFRNEVFQPLSRDTEIRGYIKNIREDGDLDLTLQEIGYGHVLSSSDKILQLLNANKGILELGDKSSPEKVIAITGMSKKVFKKAIGDLYKKKLVLLEKEQVRLVE